jgi:hypothetical protein
MGRIVLSLMARIDQGRSALGFRDFLLTRPPTLRQSYRFPLQLTFIAVVIHAIDLATFHALFEPFFPPPPFRPKCPSEKLRFFEGLRIRAEFPGVLIGSTRVKERWRSDDRSLVGGGGPPGPATDEILRSQGGRGARA